MSDETFNSISGTYIKADIDGIAVENTRFSFNCDGTFTEVVDDMFGGRLTGRYTLSGRRLFIEYDKITAEHEMLKCFPEEARQKEAEQRNPGIVNRSGEYIITDNVNKYITPVGREHDVRISIYENIAHCLREAAKQAGICGEEGVYGILSSDRKRCVNIKDPDAFFEDSVIDKMNFMITAGSDMSRFTKIKGLSDFPDLRDHAWAVVTHGNRIAAVGVGQAICSDICALSSLFVKTASGRPAILYGRQKPSTIDGMCSLYAGINYYLNGGKK